MATYSPASTEKWMFFKATTSLLPRTDGYTFLSVRTSKIGISFFLRYFDMPADDIERAMTKDPSDDGSSPFRSFVPIVTERAMSSPSFFLTSRSKILHC